MRRGARSGDAAEEFGPRECRGNPLVGRALATIPVCRVGSIRNTIKQLQTEGFQIVAATEKSRKLLYDADFRKPTALVMGAEDTGISKEVLKLCDEQLAIPLIGHIESLNVSAAAAVMLFEVVRQRIGQ